MFPIDYKDTFGSDMDRYLNEYGWHFTKKLCHYAVSRMKNKDGDPISPISHEQYAELLNKYNITISNDKMHDGVFVANMCKADYYKRSVPDEQHLAMFVKDYLEDRDAPDGVAMRRWYITMMGKGEPIDWDEVYDE